MADPTSNAFPGASGAPEPARAANLQPGMILGDTYQITRVIGQGGMGAVWEANHLRLSGKKVVVKVLLHGAADAVVLARFRREAEIGSRLGHPNIVQLLDFNTLPDGAPYLVMELLSGETLSSRLRRGRMSLEQVRGVVSQVGSALAAAHREGIVHRDLKPDNIFLCPTDLGGETRDVVKILDFGISKMRGANTVLTQDSALIGTPQYMAPEQATGANDDIDARTDVFAFGAITFEMFAGRPPFWGDSLASVVYAVVYAPSPPLSQHAPEVPPTVAAAVARALEKNRDARFPDVLSFVRAVTGVGEASSAALGSASTMATPMPGALPLMSPLVGRTIRLDEGVADAGVSPSKRVTTPERPQSAIPTNRVERPRSNPATRVLIGVAALAVVFGALFVLTRKSPALKLPTEAAKTLIEPAEAKPSRTAEAGKPHVQEAPTQEAPTHETTAGKAKAEGQPRHAKSEPKADVEREAKSGRDGTRDEVMSPAALADLEEAERALDAGKPAEALRLAQHSLYAQKSSRAYAVMARARCGQGDLGNAKAAFALVARGQRGPVARACRKLGIELR